MGGASKACPSGSSFSTGLLYGLYDSLPQLGLAESYPVDYCAPAVTDDLLMMKGRKRIPSHL